MNVIPLVQLVVVKHVIIKDSANVWQTLVVRNVIAVLLDTTIIPLVRAVTVTCWVVLEDHVTKKVLSVAADKTSSA